MALYAITYTYDTSRLDEIARLRPEHRAHLGALHRAGVDLASGPWTDGAPGALLLIRAESAQAALEAVAEDPFHVAGLITRREARGWDPVVGDLA
jgi:uncharacterized protein YciI